MEADRHMTLYPAQLLWWTQQPVAHDGYDTTEIVLGVCYDQGAKKGVTMAHGKKGDLRQSMKKVFFCTRQEKEKGARPSSAEVSPGVRCVSGLNTRS